MPPAGITRRKSFTRCQGTGVTTPLMRNIDALGAAQPLFKTEPVAYELVTGVAARAGGVSDLRIKFAHQSRHQGLRLRATGAQRYGDSEW